MSAQASKLVLSIPNTTVESTQSVEKKQTAEGSAQDFENFVLEFNTKQINKLRIDKDLEDKQYIILMEALKHNKTVKELLIHCNLNKIKLTLLYEALEINTNVSEIDFVTSTVESTSDFLQFLMNLKDLKSITLLDIRSIVYDDYLFEYETRKTIAKPKNFVPSNQFSSCRRTPDVLLNALYIILEESNLKEIYFSPKYFDVDEQLNKSSINLAKAKGFLPAKYYRSIQSMYENYCIKVETSFDFIISQMTAENTQHSSILDLSHRTLDGNQIQQIIQAMSDNRNRLLSLNLQCVKVDKTAFAKLLKVLASHPTLQELNLNWLRLTGDWPVLDDKMKCTPLQEAFKDLGSNRVLTKLHLCELSKEFYDNDTLSIFLDNLAKNQRVESSNPMDQNRSSNLFHLDLSRSRIHNVFGVNESKKLAELCALSTSLEVLILRELGTTLDPILQALADNSYSKIRVLEICGDTIEKTGLNNIRKILMRKTIKILKLTCSKIDAEGAKILAEGLICNYSLEELDLSYNKIGNIQSGNIHNNSSLDGFHAICRALTNNKKSVLESLHLKGNDIASAVEEPVVNLLLQNQTLNFLDLESNEISNMKTLANCLMINHSLTDLRINNPDKKNIDEVLKSFAEAMEKNKKMRGFGFHAWYRDHQHRNNLTNAIHDAWKRNEENFETGFEQILETTPIKELFLFTYGTRKPKKVELNLSTFKPNLLK